VLKIDKHGESGVCSRIMGKIKKPPARHAGRKNEWMLMSMQVTDFLF